MMGFFEEIVRTKRNAVAQRQTAVPLEALKETITTLGRPRNFFNSVTRPPKGKRVNLIVEIDVKDSALSAVELAQSLAGAGVDALSVRTDTADLEQIHAIRDAVKTPVMRRDVIIDPYQVYESRAAGADAILIIAEALETSQLIDLQILATELNMTCVLEVHDIENLIRVRDAVIGFPHRSYSLLAINNRALGTDKIDLGTTTRMAELLEDREVLISEGGINTFEDVKKLTSAGVRAILVPSGLLGNDDISVKIRELVRLK